jgi:DNA-binding protein H-NS
MGNIDLNSMSVDELQALHHDTASILRRKMQAEKLKLKKRLEQIRGKSRHRPYPKAYPKFRNPESPDQTWSGPGKQPVWMRKLLARGVSMRGLRI